MPIIHNTIRTNSELDVYPTHEAKLGKGGYRTVVNIAERDNIPFERCEEGMLVTVLEDYTNNNETTTYILKQYSRDDKTWEKFNNEKEKIELTNRIVALETLGAEIDNKIETLSDKISTKASLENHNNLAASLETYALKSDLVNLATKGEISTKADLSNLDNLATKDEVNAKLDISLYTAEKVEFATKDELNTLVYTKSQVDEKIATAVSGGSVNPSRFIRVDDISNLATKDELNTKANLSDLENLATKDELNEYALKSEINTSGGIDENALNEVINNNSNIQELELKVNQLSTNLQEIKREKGEKGEQGERGLKGEKGDRGEQGLKGDKGDQGIQGIQGEKGEKGDKGERGEKGEKGDKGDKGEQGERGLQGLKGDKGDKGDRGEQGIQGLKGDKGDKGDRGEQGIQGIQGERGLKGDKGDTPTLKTINGQSLVGSGDITIQTDTSSLETTLAELQTKMGKLLRVFSEEQLDELARWQRADLSRWSNVFGGSSVGVGDVIRFNNAKSAFLAPENVRGIKFKLTGRANPGGYILWLLCSTNRSNQSDIRALTVDFQTYIQETYTNWIKPREGHTSYNGSHGATADDIKGVFNCHNVEITVLFEDNKIKCSNALGYRFEINAFGGSGFITRLGLGSQANFSNNAEAYDIKILTN